MNLAVVANKWYKNYITPTWHQCCVNLKIITQLVCHVWLLFAIPPRLILLDWPASETDEDINRPQVSGRTRWCRTSWSHWSPHWSSRILVLGPRPHLLAPSLSTAQGRRSSCHDSVMWVALPSALFAIDLHWEETRLFIICCGTTIYSLALSLSYIYNFKEQNSQTIVWNL